LPSGETVGFDVNSSGRAADLAAVQKARQQDIAATLSADPVALTDLWTDDAVRIGPVPSAEVGKQAIRESNERLTANKDFKVLSYVPEYKLPAYYLGNTSHDSVRIVQSTYGALRKSLLKTSVGLTSYGTVRYKVCPQSSADSK
jgi:hypothetical protein